MYKKKTTQHRMTRRSASHDYTGPGIYHITIHVADAAGQPLGAVVGNPDAPDGALDAPHTELSPIGQMVERELLTAIHAHYAMITVLDHVIMPDHLHFLLEVQDKMLSKNGKTVPLGTVIAGFKKGCNRRYWELIGCGGETTAHTAAPPTSTPESAAPQASAPESAAPQASTPQASTPQASTPESAAPSPGSVPASFPGGAPSPCVVSSPGSVPASFPGGAPSPCVVSSPGSVPAGFPGGAPSPCVVSSPGSVPAGFPGGAPSPYKVPSSAKSRRQPLFAPEYCDVMPIDAAQLATQRAYIQGNPRSRLLRMGNRTMLTTQRFAITTALTPAALRGYLQRECPPHLVTPEVLAAIEARLLIAPSLSAAAMPTSMRSGSTAGVRYIACDTFGPRALLTERRCLPVVCHKKDAARFGEQKQRCLDEAAKGAVLVSASISSREREIIIGCVNHGFPVITIHDNGFPNRYHPSAERLDSCAAGHLLIVSPWQYQYRGKNEHVTVPFCKAMNCVAQALCRTKDSWWKE
jgi:hypothetical protein